MSVKSLQEVISIHVLQQNMRGYLHNTLDALKLFSNIYIDVATTGLGKWRKSTRLGKAQNTGLASNVCKLALDIAQFSSQAVCLGPNILFCPRSGNMAHPRSQGKHRVHFCWVMFGWHFLKESAQENKNLIFIGHHNKNKNNSSSLNRVVAFPPFTSERLVEKQAMRIVMGSRD